MTLDLSGGARKRQVARSTKVVKGTKKSAKSQRSKKKPLRHSRTAPRGSRKSAKQEYERPKTAKIISRKSRSEYREHPSKAHSSMSITELQFLAKSRGVPWGGLTKTKLIRKINNYYY
jgi:hypothetical protein